LFGYIEDGTVKNLGVETADKGIEGRSNVGVITGQLLGGRIENCYTSGNINIILTGSNAGGIAGSVSADAVIINSHSTVSVYSAGADYIGGIAGQISGSATVEECYSAGDLRGARYVGGIAGETAGNVTIVKSRYTGDISGTSELGGIVGSASGTVITDSYSAGSVIGSGTIIGGIVGRSSSSLEITRSHSVAYLASSAANSYVGGIVGNVPSGAAVISGSYFAGMIRATGLSGGIAGSLGGSGTGSKIENCFSSGYIFSTGGSSIGGIAGQISGIVSVTKNYFTGTVNTAGTGSVGGLIGYIQSSTTVAVTDNILASPAIYNTGSGTAKNRLVGNIAVGATRTVIGNLAYDGIDTVGAFTNTTDEENHGTDAALEDLTARSTYTGIQQWAFGDDDEHPWKWGAFSDYPYPTLYWQTERP
jgi:hypothetical protein